MRSRPIAAALLGLGVLLAACGGGTSSAAPATPAPATPAPVTQVPSPAASQPAAAGSVQVAVASTSLGDIVVDGAGMTLYMFTADSGGTSACTGDCLASWPVLAGAQVAAGEGLDAADFASITRDDGSSQVTFNGMPLYYFAGDKAPGDVTGQGVGGKWYVLAPDGSVVR